MTGITQTHTHTHTHTVCVGDNNPSYLPLFSCKMIAHDRKSAHSLVMWGWVNDGGLGLTESTTQRVGEADTEWLLLQPPHRITRGRRVLPNEPDFKQQLLTIETSMEIYSSCGPTVYTQQWRREMNCIPAM